MKLERILIIGAGAMGRTIAQWFLQQLAQVWLLDRELSLAQKAADTIDQSWNALVAKNKLAASDVASWQKNLHPVASLNEVPANVDLAIEAIIEHLSAKRELLQQLTSHLSHNVWIASNTSSLSLAELASTLPQDRRAKMIGMHFFNPATIMKLVELVQILPEQHQSLLELKNWFEARGKVAVICRDRPGLIVNRLARNYYGEAMRLARPYDANSYALIDKVMTQIAGHTMGPFELMDFIGHDINLTATRTVWQQCGLPARLAPHFLQEQLVQAGATGKKSGQGFYTYPLGAPVVDLIVPGQHHHTDQKHVAVIVNRANMPLWQAREQLASHYHLVEYKNLSELQMSLQQSSYEWIVDTTVLPSEEKHFLLEWLSPKAAQGILCESCGEDIPLLRQLHPVIRAFTASAFPARSGHDERWEVVLSDRAHAPMVMGLLSHLANTTGTHPLVHWGDHLILPSIIALIVSEAFHAKAEELCHETEMDLALQYGVNYPRGPWAWLDRAGACVFYTWLANRQRATGDTRYAPHALLRQRALHQQHHWQHQLRGHL